MKAGRLPSLLLRLWNNVLSAFYVEARARMQIKVNVPICARTHIHIVHPNG